MVPIVEPLLAETGVGLSSLENELVLLTLQRFNDAVAAKLTPSCCEMRLLLSVIKCRRYVATSACLLASEAIPQVSVAFHTWVCNIWF